jgi:nitrogen fixation NifU-like protein
MSDLRDLYQDVILDHGRQPRNVGRLSPASHHADGFNPLCGDKIHLTLQVDAQQVIREVRFAGQGCAISMASASLMSEALKGKTVTEAHALFQQFHNLLVAQPAPLPGKELGKLAALIGVREFPARIKCATLAWHTLECALAGENDTASSE